MSFLDPYEGNRSLSLIAWLRIGVWIVMVSVAALLWWWWS